MCGHQYTLHNKEFKASFRTNKTLCYHVSSLIHYTNEFINDISTQTTSDSIINIIKRSQQFKNKIRRQFVIIKLLRPNKSTDV